MKIARCHSPATLRTWGLTSAFHSWPTFAVQISRILDSRPAALNPQRSLASVNCDGGPCPFAALGRRHRVGADGENRSGHPPLGSPSLTEDGYLMREGRLNGTSFL